MFESLYSISQAQEELKLLQKKGKQSRLVAAAPISFLNSKILSHSPAHYYLPSSFHVTDPFLYYSIPGVREATLSLTEVDYSNVLQSAGKVSRKTRVSFESHEIVAENELFGGDLDGLEDMSLGELDDLVRNITLNTNGNGSI